MCLMIVCNFLVDHCFADGFRNRNAVFSHWLSIGLCLSAVTRTATKARITKAAQETVDSIHEIFNIGMTFRCVC